MSEREGTPEKIENGSHVHTEGSLKSKGSQSPRHRSRSISPQRFRSLSKSSSHSRIRRMGRPRRSRSRSRTPRFPPRRYFRERRSSYEFSRNARFGMGGSGSLDFEFRNFRRSHSRSPMSSRRRHQGNRDNPPTGRCLGVFGLNIYTQERDLKDVFSRYGNLEDVQIVYDAQTGRSRGFAFVYFENSDDALNAKEKCNGIEVGGKKIRVDFSITQRAHTPTPGIYMGKPSHPRSRGRGGRRGGHGHGHSGSSYADSRDYFDNRDGYPRERTPSPYCQDRRRYTRSRSRSLSPR